MKVWRLTLECGHLRLSGPWGDDEPDDKHMIGDITWCEVCPRVADAVDRRPVFVLRLVVDVEAVPAGRYREPDEKASRGRADQLAEHAVAESPTDRLERLWREYQPRPRPRPVV